MRHNKLFIHIFLVLTIFGLSVFVRLPNLNEPLGRQHEWILAHTLVTLKIWEKEGLAKHHFSPVYTFSDKADKNINLLGGVKDADGNYYYTSYPPFAFLFPHFIFHSLGIPIVPLSLRILSLIIHFFCSCFVLLIINLIYKKSIRHHIFLPSVLGFAVYTFAEGNLWFHANLYFCDMLMQLLFMACIYFYLRIKMEGQKKWLLVIFGITNCLAVYTEWLGLLLAAVLGIISLAGIMKNKQKKILFLIISSTTILALAITFFQYSSIAGSKTFLTAASEKYQVRSGLNTTLSEYGFDFSNPASYKKLDGNYNGNYKSVIQLLGLVIPVFVLLSIWKKKYFLNAKEGMVIGLILTPILLHHLLFFNFSVVHDFSAMKVSFLFIIICALLLARILLFLENFSALLKFTGIISIIFFFGLKLFQAKENYLIKYDPAAANPHFRNTGETIRKTAKAGFTLFTNGEIGPELMFYSERNIIPAKNIKEAEEKLIRIHGNNGIFYDVDQGEIVDVVLLNEKAQTRAFHD